MQFFTTTCSRLKREQHGRDDTGSRVWSREYTVTKLLNLSQILKNPEGMSHVVEQPLRFGFQTRQNPTTCDEDGVLR